VVIIRAGTGATIRFAVHVQPRASRTEVLGQHGDALKVRLAAPPVDGGANEELARYLAEVLRVPRRSIVLVSGHSARRKVVEVPAEARDRVEALTHG
jgi:uncharacterized protein (TIGR00251 family)